MAGAGEQSTGYRNRLRSSMNGIGRFDEIYWRNVRSFERTPLIAAPMLRL
jgi:hypothetical protein